ncbi:hypothetical protein GCM10007047_11060 [Cerasicoccus arenae]|uniref:Uncharacterized protein n=2 Tax=Cerasicoccus arenae TaxID=424488 RepID=A0A8J3GE75_9BACT|nr:hypothetical protein GCM10007047_11060 [Cerasicoccus arenae]
MMDQYSESEHPSDMTPKQRFDLERWARLNDMTLEEFLESDLLQQLNEFRARRSKNQSASSGDNGTCERSN